jgi:hypothetical protein
MYLVVSYGNALASGRSGAWLDANFSWYFLAARRSFLDLEMNTGAMKLVGDISVESLFSRGYLAVKSLIIGASKQYINSILGGNLILLSFPWAPPTIT